MSRDVHNIKYLDLPDPFDHSERDREKGNIEENMKEQFGWRNYTNTQLIKREILILANR